MADGAYDAIVVGARCAGSPTAMLLARRGYRVLLVDRATFPSDVGAGHYIHHAGTGKLAEWGLLDRVAASNCPPIFTVTIDLGEVRFVADYRSGTVDFGTFQRKLGGGMGSGAATYSPRRKVLDKILVDAAVEAGAELREAFTVEHVVFRDGEACGISGRARGGRPVTETARVVIGADGRGSVVAREVGADTLDEHPMLTCGWRGYWSGVDVEGLEYYPREGRAVLAMPTNDGLVWISAGARREDYAAMKRQVERSYAETIETVAPPLAARMRRGTREERLSGSGFVPNHLRRPHGPGWALVGDAGYAHDPTSGQGISDAFRDAGLLADALDDGLAGRRPLAEALAEYARRRDEAVQRTYPVALGLGKLEAPSAAMFQLFGALAGEGLPAAPS